MASELPRPAFYALAPGGWRDYVTLLHPPYTAWHLSYVVVGATLAPVLDVPTLAATLTAFFLAVGIGAHSLDELMTRPLRTGIRSLVLALLAACSVAAAVALGIYGAVAVDPWLGLFVAAGAFILCAYNLELAAGRFHSDLWFALAWGSFPLVVGYFAQTGEIRVDVIAGAAFAFATSLAQRRLSTQVRDVRRRVVSLDGELERADGSREPVTRELLTAAPEAALRALVVAWVALAASLLLMRLT